MVISLSLRWGKAPFKAGFPATRPPGGWEAKQESKGRCVPLSRLARRLEMGQDRGRSTFLEPAWNIWGGNIPVVDSRLPRGGYPQLRWRRRRDPLLGRLGVGSRSGRGAWSGSSSTAAARVSLAQVAPPTVESGGAGSHGRTLNCGEYFIPDSRTTQAP